MRDSHGDNVRDLECRLQTAVADGYAAKWCEHEWCARIGGDGNDCGRGERRAYLEAASASASASALVQ